MTVLDYVTKHSYNYFSNQLSGTLANKVSDLARSLEHIRLIVSWNIIATFAVTIVALVIMATINITFTIIILSWVVFNIVISVYQSKKVSAIAKTNADDRSKLSGIIVDVLANITSVKLFARQKYEYKYVAKQQEKEKISNKNIIIALNKYMLSIDIPSHDPQ